VEIAHRANDLTRTLGVAFDGATMPGATSGLFVIEPGQMEIGLGIHGEPGVDDVPLANADAVAGVLVDGVLAEHPASESHRIAVVLNGLGATKYEELFVLWAAIAPRLRAHGYEIVSPEIGELITSLDMAGCSLTLTWLDDDLERYWLAPAMTPAYRRGSVDTTTTALRVVSPDAHSADVGTVAVAGEEAEAARRVVAMLGAAASAIAENEAALGALDAIAGDGDHGRGMRRGVDAAVEAATSSAASGASASQVLGAAGAAWADRAGGSSGVLWGAALMAAAGRLGSGAEDSEAIVAAVRAAADAIATLGKAELGDKTMLDALIPFSDRLAYGVAGGEPLRTAWRMAAETAGDAAKATSILRPRIGRARPLAAKSVGHPDPGAVSFALIVSALASLYEPRSGSAIDPAQVNEMRNH
jgi:dihydroxyacetone kinase